MSMRMAIRLGCLQGAMAASRTELRCRRAGRALSILLSGAAAAFTPWPRAS